MNFKILLLSAVTLIAIGCNDSENSSSTHDEVPKDKYVLTVVSPLSGVNFVHSTQEITIRGVLENETSPEKLDLSALDILVQGKKAQVTDGEIVEWQAVATIQGGPNLIDVRVHANGVEVAAEELVVHNSSIENPHGAVHSNGYEYGVSLGAKAVYRRSAAGEKTTLISASDMAFDSKCRSFTVKDYLASIDGLLFTCLTFSSGEQSYMLDLKSGRVERFADPLSNYWNRVPAIDSRYIVGPIIENRVEVYDAVSDSKWTVNIAANDLSLDSYFLTANDSSIYTIDLTTSRYVSVPLWGLIDPDVHEVVAELLETSSLAGFHEFGKVFYFDDKNLMEVDIHDGVSQVVTGGDRGAGYPVDFQKEVPANSVYRIMSGSHEGRGYLRIFLHDSDVFIDVNVTTGERALSQFQANRALPRSEGLIEHDGSLYAYDFSSKSIVRADLDTFSFESMPIDYAGLKLGALPAAVAVAADNTAYVIPRLQWGYSSYPSEVALFSVDLNSSELSASVELTLADVYYHLGISLADGSIGMEDVSYSASEDAVYLSLTYDLDTSMSGGRGSALIRYSLKEGMLDGRYDLSPTQNNLSDSPPYRLSNVSTDGKLLLSSLSETALTIFNAGVEATFEFGSEYSVVYNAHVDWSSDTVLAPAFHRVSEESAYPVNFSYCDLVAFDLKTGDYDVIVDARKVSSFSTCWSSPVYDSERELIFLGGGMSVMVVDRVSGDGAFLPLSPQSAL